MLQSLIFKQRSLKLFLSQNLVSKLLFRKSEVGDYDFVGDPVSQSFKSDSNVFAPAGIIAVR